MISSVLGHSGPGRGVLDTAYVNVSGDTMTGALIMNTTGVRHDTSVVALFGTTGQAGISYDGTNLLIRPKISGTGWADFNASDIKCFGIGIGGSSPSASTLVSCALNSSAYSQITNLSLTYTGSSALVRALQMTAINQSTATSPVAQSLLTTQLAINNTPAATANPTGNGVRAVSQITVAQTVASSQTKNVITTGGEFFAQGDSLAHDGSGGTLNFVRRSIRAMQPGVLSGNANATDNQVAIACEGDFLLVGGMRLYLEGTSSSTALAVGDSYVDFDTNTANKIRFTVDATTAVDIRAATINFKDAYDLVLGTGTGTKIGTGITQKIGVYGVTPIAQRAGAAQDAVATTGATSTTPFGYTTAAQADAIVTLVNELRAWAVAQGWIKGAA